MSEKTRSIAIAAGLVLATILAFWPAAGFDFVELDDRSYVVENPNVTGGLSGANVAWALTSFRQANWHPLTWISLQADASRGDKTARSYHVTNIALHALAAALLFLALQAMTGSTWAPAAAALLFAVHPLRVESVVWIAERKDVLSQVFAFATLLAWTRWIEKPGTSRYTLALALFALGLLAKPMLVTLPVLMLLLDRWPFDRFHLLRGIQEKLPFFGLAGISSIVTYVAQAKGGAVGALSDFPFSTRLANACVAAVDYLITTVWPVNLATPYPYDLARLTPGRVALSALVLIALTALAARAWKSRPHLAVGWAWYLVTLLPVAGILQVGSQARADRYTYLPLVGPVMALVWEIAARLTPLDVRRRAAIAATVVVALVLPAAWATRAQAALWKDSETLFRHTVAVTGPNAVAHFALGLDAFHHGRHDESIAELKAALSISERYPEAWTALGEASLAAGRMDEAVAAYRRAVQLGASDPALSAKMVAGLNAIAMSRMKSGDIPGAEAALLEAIAAAPGNATTHASLGVLYARSGRLDDAEREFAEAVRLDPANPGYRSNLERVRRMRR